VVVADLPCRKEVSAKRGVTKRARPAPLTVARVVEVLVVVVVVVVVRVLLLLV